MTAGRAALLVTFGLTALLPRAASSQVTFASDLASEMEGIGDWFNAQEGWSGVALVAIDDSLVLHRAWGSASPELGVATTTEHRFLLASLAKTLTAAAVLRLVDEGRIDLAASVSRHLPEAGLDPAITIHQLLSHTAGLHRDLLPGTGHGRGEHFETADRLALVAAQGQRFVPGERYAYSSQGYVVLAAVIEAVTGEAFPVAMQRLVFAPLGMDHTSVEELGVAIPGRTVRQVLFGAEVMPAPFEDPTFGYGSGSVWSTAMDLWRFGRALLDPGFLTESSRSAMLREHVRGHGYGIRPFEYGTGPRIGKGTGRGAGYDGGTAGVSTKLNILFDHRTVIVLLSNRTPVRLGRLSNHLLNLAVGYPPEVESVVHDPTEIYRLIRAAGTDSATRLARAWDVEGSRHLLPTPGDLFRTGHVLYLHRRLGEAERVLDFLLQVAPSPEAWTVRGRVAMAKGDTATACAAYESSRHLGSEVPNLDLSSCPERPRP